MRTLACVLLVAVLGIPSGVAQTSPTSLKKAAAAAPARKPPAFSLLRPGAAPLPLSQYRGKVVALIFISTVCSHCQDFTKAINPIARKYAARGVQFVECAVNDAADVGLKQFITQFQPAFPVGWGTQEAMMSFLGVTPLDDPNARYVPHMVLLDRAGLMRGDFSPGSDFYKDPTVSVPAALDKLLK
jgi:thiol-disulfide isomerase/thioredoxin